MPREVIFPKVDMDMESGLLSEWLCANGDHVAEGQPIFVIETDKSAMEIEAVASGRIAIGESATGTQYPVGQVMAYIFESHESFTEADRGSENANVSVETDPSASPKTSQPVPSSNDEFAVAGQSQVSAGGSVRASPAARRIAAEYGIVLSEVTGSARKGRIVKADVVAVTSARQSVDLPVESLVNELVEGSTGLDTGASRVLKRVPHSPMRRTITSRLVDSVRTIPSYQVVVDCYCESLLQTSREVNDGIANGLVAADFSGKVSLNVFFIRALALALRDYPEANCHWANDETILFKDVDVGMAVALEGGLITPIVRSANQKTVFDIARETGVLIERARKGALVKQEYEGGVTTVSNLGMYGIPEFTSIINPPQTSIVSIGSVEHRAVVVDRQVQIRPECRTTFAFDHRVIDGAAGARVAQRFKEYVENSVRLLL